MVQKGLPVKVILVLLPAVTVVVPAMVAVYTAGANIMPRKGVDELPVTRVVSVACELDALPMSCALIMSVVLDAFTA